MVVVVARNSSALLSSLLLRPDVGVCVAVAVAVAEMLMSCAVATDNTYQPVLLSLTASILHLA